jgi:hypothetical protein
MRKLRQFFLFVFATAFVFALAANAQDDAQPSLGDVARQARQQKQQKDAQAAQDAQTKDSAQSKDSAQTKDAQAKDKDKAPAANDVPPRKATHVVTNEEIPEHVGPTRTLGSQNQGTTYGQPSYNEPKAPSDYWKSQIMAQKNSIANLKSDIDSLTASIQYAPGNCVSGCVQWNERQQQKQQQVDSMKVQLEQMEKHLEDMQEAARKQGYGSSVYDP